LVLHQSQQGSRARFSAAVYSRGESLLWAGGGWAPQVGPLPRALFFDWLFEDSTACTAASLSSSGSRAAPGVGKRKAESAVSGLEEEGNKKSGNVCFPWVDKLNDLASVSVPLPRSWPPARREQLKEGVSLLQCGTLSRSLSRGAGFWIARMASGPFSQIPTAGAA